MQHLPPRTTPLQLPLTGTAIEDCRDHINQYPETDAAILAYLTRHVNGLMCAEIEQVVTRLIRERIGLGCSDEATRNYLGSLRRSAVRNAKVSEIRNTLALLGNTYRDRFNNLVDRTAGEDGIEKLGTAVAKRDQDAHDQPPDITFRELEEVYGIATEVVVAVRQSLEV